jgi:acarbose 7IV-phosphotransferase
VQPVHPGVLPAVDLRVRSTGHPAGLANMYPIATSTPVTSPPDLPLAPSRNVFVMPLAVTFRVREARPTVENRAYALRVAVSGAVADVVVCGPSSWNQIVRVPRLPRAEPHTVFAAGHCETLGGTSAGKALHLTDLGRSVLLHTVLGTDAAAVRIERALAGVPVLAEVVDGPSERHLNLMDPHGGRVSIYLDLPAASARPLAPELSRSMASARAIVLDLAERSLDVMGDARASGVPIWTDIHDYDGVSDFHRPFVAAATYVFMNADGLAQPLDFMRAAVDAGAAAVVCTLGAEGAVAVDSGHAVLRVPAAPVADVVDTNGAGDGFMAGFLDASLDGASTEAALGAGARQAARALTSRHLSPLLDGRPSGG